MLSLFSSRSPHGSHGVRGPQINRSHRENTKELSIYQNQYREWSSIAIYGILPYLNREGKGNSFQVGDCSVGMVY